MDKQDFFILRSGSGRKGSVEPHVFMVTTIAMVMPFTEPHLHLLDLGRLGDVNVLAQVDQFGVIRHVKTHL